MPCRSASDKLLETTLIYAQTIMENKPALNKIVQRSLSLQFIPFSQRIFPLTGALPLPSGPCVLTCCASPERRRSGALVSNDSGAQGPRLLPPPRPPCGFHLRPSAHPVSLQNPGMGKTLLPDVLRLLLH